MHSFQNTCSGNRGGDDPALGGALNLRFPSLIGNGVACIALLISDVAQGKVFGWFVTKFGKIRANILEILGALIPTDNVPTLPSDGPAGSTSKCSDRKARR